MRIITLLVVVSCLFACTDVRHDFEFRALENGQFDAESMVVDVQYRQVRGRDTSYEFSVLDSPVAKGFVAPFPISLPKLPVKEMPPTWEMEGYRFTLLVLLAMDADWVLITAGQPVQPLTNSTNLQYSSVLYSSTKGVIAMRVRGGSVANTLFSCGTKQLRSSSFDASSSSTHSARVGRLCATHRNKRPKRGLFPGEESEPQNSRRQRHTTPRRLSQSPSHPFAFRTTDSSQARLNLTDPKGKVHHPA